MMKKMMSEISGAAIISTSESRISIVNAITAAPMTRNGARTARRMNILTPFCTVMESLVRRFTSEEVPILSMLV